MTLAACATEGTKVFGEHTTPCPATVLTNDGLDVAIATIGGDCLLAEFEAGRPVVWDLLVPTVEGDPLLWRYDFDGETVTITEDQTRDEFGSAGVTVRVCRGVQRAPGTAFLEGVECTSSSGDGFRSDSLPTG